MYTHLCRHERAFDSGQGREAVDPRGSLPGTHRPEGARGPWAGRRMKILLVNTLYYPASLGGAEVSVQALAEGLQASGHEVRVLTSALDAGAGTGVVNGVGVEYVVQPNLYSAPLTRAVSRFARLRWHLRDRFNRRTPPLLAERYAAWCPDVVNTNNLSGFSVSVWRYFRNRGIPVVHTLRDYYLICPRATMCRGGEVCRRQCMSCAYFSIAKKRESNGVDAVVGISRFIADLHRREGYFSKAVFNETIGNIYEPPAGTRERPPRSEPFTVGYLGRISKEKGLEDLLSAVEKARRTRSIRLLVAGTGEPAYRDALEERFRHRDTRFLGTQDPASFFVKIHLLAVPSRWLEPLGRVVLEAHAHGVPVLVPNRGGLPEMVEHGVNGLIYEGELSLDAIGPDDLPAFDPDVSKSSRQAIVHAYEHLLERVVACRAAELA